MYIYICISNFRDTLRISIKVALIAILIKVRIISSGIKRSERFTTALQTSLFYSRFDFISNTICKCKMFCCCVKIRHEKERSDILAPLFSLIYKS